MHVCVCVCVITTNICFHLHFHSLYIYFCVCVQRWWKKNSLYIKLNRSLFSIYMTIKWIFCKYLHTYKHTHTHLESLRIEKKKKKKFWMAMDIYYHYHSSIHPSLSSIVFSILHCLSVSMYVAPLLSSSVFFCVYYFMMYILDIYKQYIERQFLFILSIIIVYQIDEKTKIILD